MRETSSVTTRTVLGYLRQTAGDEAVVAVLSAAQLPDSQAELEDVNHWVSYDSRIRLFAAVVDYLGDPDVMFEVGRSSTRQNVAPSVTLAMRSFGSPTQVYRVLPRLVAKYSTTSTMTLIEAGRTYATFSFKLHEGYEHSRLDCQYAQGLIASVPQLFGLPAARILHDECESYGAPACIYRVTWVRWSRWSRRRRQDGIVAETEIVALRRQLADLRSAAGDLVGGDDLAHVLRRIVERAATAVLAHGYLLAVRDQNGEALVHTHGLTEAEAKPLAADLLAGRSLGPSAVVVDVASAARHHGWLAALHGPDQEGLHHDREALSGYARHAAAALDMMRALEDSRRDAERARALLELAHLLTDCADVQAIAEVVADALPGIVGCESSGVWLWDDSEGLLRAVSWSGGSEAGQEATRNARVSPTETPELADLLADPQPLVLTKGAHGESLEALLAALEVEQCILVPLLSAGSFHGIATASWRTHPNTRDSDSELMLRLRGVGHQAAGALRNSYLAERVRQQAERDDLTGLPNRRVFLERLERALGSRRRTDTSDVGVLFCDLDGFKAVNDRYGHAVGDALLCQVAIRLSGAVRDGDEVARLSGDEFAVLLPTVAEHAEAEAVARRIVECLARPFAVEGVELVVTASVGVAFDHEELDAKADATTSPEPPVRDGIDDAADAADASGRGGALLRQADQAMYVAKQRGRNQVAHARSTAATLIAPPRDHEGSIDDPAPQRSV